MNINTDVAPIRFYQDLALLVQSLTTLIADLRQCQEHKDFMIIEGRASGLVEEVEKIYSELKKLDLFEEMFSFQSLDVYSGIEYLIDMLHSVNSMSLRIKIQAQNGINDEGIMR